MDTTLLNRFDRLAVWPYPRRVLAVIGSAYFFGFFDVVNVGDALPAIKHHFHIGTETASLAITLGLFGYVIGAVLDAWISDRIGRRQALFGSVAMFSIGTLISGLAPTFAWLVVGRVITGMGIGAEIAAVGAYLSEIAPAHLRGKASGQSVLWGYSAFAVVPFISLALVPNFVDGWRWLFYIGAAGGLAILPLRRHLPDSPRWLLANRRDEEARQAVEAAERFVEKMPAREHPVVVAPTPTAAMRPFGVSVALLLITWFCYYMANYGWVTLAPTLLVDHGFSLKGSLAFLCISGIGYVAGSAASIVFADRGSRRWSIGGSLVFASLGFAAIGAWPHGVIITVSGFLLSASVGLAIPMLYTYTAEQFHDTVRARGVAISNGFGHFGGAVAPMIILPVAAWSFFAGFLVMGGMCLVTAGLVALGPNATRQTID